MKKKRLSLIEALVAVLLLTGFFAPEIDVLALEGDDSDVTEYDQQNPAVTQYLDGVTYPPDDYSYSLISDYVTETDYNRAEPFGVKIDVPQDSTITLTDGDHQMSFPIKGGERTIYNLTPGRISTYQITDDAGEVIAEGRLKPTGALRMLNTSGTRNVRDLGGWACDGGTVKYGMLFRGGEVRTWDVNLFHNLLGIRAELNMRWDEEVERDYSIIGEDVDFKHISGPWYTLYPGEKWEEDAHRQMLDYIMDNVIAGCPLYFHCAAGADRTGTLAFILESILGVSQSDTDKDYELTSFRTGVDNDDDARRRDESEWKNYMAMFQRYRGDTMRDRVISWALSIGISIDKINAFRQAMIDGEPELLLADGRKTTLLGDADGDVNVSILDVTVIKRHIALLDLGEEPETLMLGDVDGSGALEITDATLLQRWLSGLTVAFPIGEDMMTPTATEPDPQETVSPTEAPTAPEETAAQTEAPTDPPPVIPDPTEETAAAPEEPTDAPEETIAPPEETVGEYSETVNPQE